MTGKANISLKAVIFLIISEDYIALRKIAMNIVNFFTKSLFKVNKRLNI